MTWLVERGDGDATVLTRDDSSPFENRWGRREVRPHCGEHGSLKSELQTKLNRTAATGTNDRVGGCHIGRGTRASEKAAARRRVIVSPSILSTEWIRAVRM